MPTKQRGTRSSRKSETARENVLAYSKRSQVTLESESTEPEFTDPEKVREDTMASTTTAGVLVLADDRLKSAQRIVTYNSRWAAGLGLLPVPLLDWVAVTGFQVRMLHQLCHLYNVPYDKARATRYIAALVGGYVPTTVGFSVGSLIKAIPIVGGAGFAAVAATAYATTAGLGEIFIPFFENGGSFSSFNPADHKTPFEAAVKAGMQPESQPA